jgi:hypothetical protein
MPPSTPPPLDDWHHKPGFEIPTKHKEAIGQLHRFGKVPICALMVRYKLGESSGRKVLGYPAPERRPPNRMGPPFSLSDEAADKIILRCGQTWENCVLQWWKVREELKLKCSVTTFKRRFDSRGYYRYAACQKPYLTLVQVKAHFLRAMAHIFWRVERLKVLWSDEVIFLIGGRIAKQGVTRNCYERICETCIQHQFHRGHSTPVSAWGAIGYGYKSPLLFVNGTVKHCVFDQVDYLGQVLEHLQPIIDAFAPIAHTICPSAEPLFMEDGNSAHGHITATNYCQPFRTQHGIILMPHPSSSPDMNPIKKCWRYINEALHRRERQPTTEAELRAAITEEWNAISQEWISELI